MINPRFAVMRASGTDKLRSYTAAKRDIMPSVNQSSEQYENNRFELSH
jgi:putative transposase